MVSAMQPRSVGPATAAGPAPLPAETTQAPAARAAAARCRARAGSAHARRDQAGTPRSDARPEAAACSAPLVAVLDLVDVHPDHATNHLAAEAVVAAAVGIGRRHLRRRRRCDGKRRRRRQRWRRQRLIAGHTGGRLGIARHTPRTQRQSPICRWNSQRNGHPRASGPHHIKAGCRRSIWLMQRRHPRWQRVPWLQITTGGPSLWLAV